MDVGGDVAWESGWEEGVGVGLETAIAAAGVELCEGKICFEKRPVNGLVSIDFEYEFATIRTCVLSRVGVRFLALRRHLLRT